MLNILDIARNSTPTYARSEKGTHAKCENYITPGIRVSNQ